MLSYAYAKGGAREEVFSNEVDVKDRVGRQ